MGGSKRAFNAQEESNDPEIEENNSSVVDGQDSADHVIESPADTAPSSSMKDIETHQNMEVEDDADAIEGAEESSSGVDQVDADQQTASITQTADDLSSLQDATVDATDTEKIIPIGAQVKASQKKGKIKNPSSVWMIFSNENRDSIYKEFPLMNFTEVARTLAERYRAISPETRERLEALSKIDKERYNAEILVAKSMEGNTEDDQFLGPLSGLGGGTSTELELPLGRVRKILKLDSDVKAIGKEAIVAISKATELFIAYLGLRCANTATQRGVRTVKDLDIVQTIHALDTLDFLRLDFPKIPRAVVSDGKEKKSQQKQAAAQLQASSSGSNSIRDFFGGGGAKSVVSATAAATAATGAGAGTDTATSVVMDAPSDMDSVPITVDNTVDSTIADEPAVAVAVAVAETETGNQSAKQPRVYDAEFEAIMANIDVVITKGNDF